MSAETQSLIPDQPIEVKRKTFSNTLARVAKYTGLRLVTLFITIVIAIYLTILIANMGGYVDQILRGEIRDRITTEVFQNPGNRELTVQQKTKLAEDRIALEENRLGLNRPFAVRSMAFLRAECANFESWTFPEYDQ